MAITINLYNTRLMGSPIVCEVAVQDRSGATFHRVLLTVTVTGTLGGTSIGSGTFQFSSPVGSGGTIPFDISSAVRAVADRFTPAAATFSYPTYAVSIFAQEEYMIDGIVYQGDSATASQSGAVYIGSYTDLERIKGQTPARWSRKPTSSPQIAFAGKSLIVPGACSNGGTWTAPAVSTQTVAAGLNTTYNYYGVTAPQDGYELRFINSLGVHENVFIHCLRSSEVTYHTDKYAIARQETLTQFSRGLAVKQNNRERWKMSSGPLDKSWQQWFLHEVLMARWAWLLVGSTYLPVHILPGDTVQAVDRAAANTLTVDFTIEFDLNGSPTT